MIKVIDHVQIAMPYGEEAAARDYYGRLLGLLEVVKPPELAKRGGVWFQGPGFQIHLGIEQDFRPAKKAHPGFLVESIDQLQAALDQAGYATSEDTMIPGVRRFFTHDPFGNRLEFQQAQH